MTGPLLIVEDDDDVRGAIALFLESHGYAVLEARHGGEGLALLRGTPGIRLVLLDLMMPVMDGWTFRDRQRSDPAIAGVPVVVITADARAVGRSAALGVADFLLKPLDLDHLLAVVRAHC